LYNSDSTIALTATDLPEPVGTGDQQVRHARQVRDGRAAGNVLAQCQRQRAGGLVVFLRAQQLGQEDHLARSVRRFQADHRFAGDHIDHAHRLHRQAAGDVLVERTDLADLHAWRGFQFEAGDHRTRIGADHLRIDAEVLELELDLPRQCFQRLFAVTLGLRLGIVEQRQRRDAGAVADMEQGDLLLALGAVALLHDRRRRRLDPDRRTLGPQFRVDLARFLALLAEGARLLPLGRLLAAAAERLAQQRTQCERPLADLVHHRQPRQPGGERHRDQQQREQEQVAADRTEAAVERLAHQLAEDAAAARGEIRGGADAQFQQSGGGHEETHDADQAQRWAQVDVAIAIAVHAEQRNPGDRAEHQGQQESDVAAQIQQHVRGPGPDPSADVVQRRGDRARMRPARILRRERHQAGQQVQQQRRDHDQRDIAHQPLPTRRRRKLFRLEFLSACRGCLRHRDVLPQLGSVSY
jgi:hypothetical protein